MRSNERPSWDGVSCVWRSRKGVRLLLGNNSNALAAVSGLINAPPGVTVRHVLSVGDHSKARLVARARDGNEDAPLHDKCPMEDRLQPEHEIFIDATYPPLQKLATAFAACEAETSCRRRNRYAVLVHCNSGVNRSPTVVLAFLLSRGCSLREAYRHLLAARPTVDPLPNYRAALCHWETALRGSCSVGSETWAVHVSVQLGDEQIGWEDAWDQKQRETEALLAEAAPACSDLFLPTDTLSSGLASDSPELDPGPSARS